MAKRVLTVQEIVAILPATVPQLAALTARLTASQLHAPPEPGAWSVNDILAHLRAHVRRLPRVIAAVMEQG